MENDVLPCGVSKIRSFAAFTFEEMCISEGATFQLYKAFIFFVFFSLNSSGNILQSHDVNVYKERVTI